MPDWLAVLLLLGILVGGALIFRFGIAKKSLL